MNKNLTIALAIIGCSLIYGIYLIFIQAQPAYTAYQEIEAQKVTIESLKQQINDIKAKQAAHVKKEENETKPIYKNDVPSDGEMSAFGVMFEDVIQAAKYNKLKLYSISYNMAPAEDIVYKNVASDYNVCEMAMQLIGSYEDLKSYLQDIYNYPYLINISKLEIKPYERDKSVLIADAKIVLYSKK